MPQSICQRLSPFFSASFFSQCLSPDPSHLTPHISHLIPHTSNLRLQTSDLRPFFTRIHFQSLRPFVTASVHYSVSQSMFKRLSPCFSPPSCVSKLQFISQCLGPSGSASVHSSVSQSIFHASIHFSVFQSVFQNLNPSFSVSVHSSVTLSILQCLNPSQEYLVRPDRVLRGGAPGWSSKLVPRSQFPPNRKSRLSHTPHLTPHT